MFGQTLRTTSRSRPLGQLRPVGFPVRTGVLHARIRLASTIAKLEADLTAPNGRRFTLPTGLFINNEFVPSSAGGRITSINPTDEREICSVEAAGAADVDRAVEAARAAFEHGSPWREMAGTERGALMLRLADLVERRAADLATLETWDNGKPYAEAAGSDLPEVLSTLRYYAGWADKVHGQTIPTSVQKLAYTLKEPLGVCGQIIPWNYPLMMAAWKLGPALAAGNTVVLKPAEQTPLSALYLADLVREAGFPAGVVNIVNGHGREAGQALAGHSGVDKVAFTGSTATGKRVMGAAAASNLKGVTLETGGKSPLLVFADAPDLRQAALWAYAGALGSNMGQVCTATSRVLAQRSAHNALVTELLEIVRARTRVGDPFDPSTTHGPLVSRDQYEKVLAYVEAGVAEGATLATGGREKLSQPRANGRGFFVEPTVFTGVKTDMRIYREEVFGPVCSVATPFETEEEAVTMANDTSYGLAAALFTGSVERAHRVAARLAAGTVWVNSSQDSDFRVPFGGFRQSGFGGRELGEEGLAAYTQTKAVHVNLGTRL